jgi:hypothetical protein
MAMLLPLQLFLHQIQSAAKKIHFRASSCLKMLRPKSITWFVAASEGISLLGRTRFDMIPS